jgi:hypothetical protein
MHYDVTCHGALLMETALSPPKHEKAARTFHALDAPECTT